MLNEVVGVFRDPGVDRFYCGWISKLHALGLCLIGCLQDLLERGVYAEALLQPEGVGHGELHGRRPAYLLGQLAIGGVECLHGLDVGVQSFQDGGLGRFSCAVRGHGQRDCDASGRNEDVPVGALRFQLTQDIKAELGVWPHQHTHRRRRFGLRHGGIS